jgi:hypothetical protein
MPEVTLEQRSSSRLRSRNVRLDKPKTASSRRSGTHTKRRRTRPSTVYKFLFMGSSAVTTPARAHLQMHPRDVSLPLRVTNNCPDPIWPAILTQSGTGPASTGFMLNPGDTQSQTVGGDWIGRVWGRTNCSFPNSGTGPASGSGGAACDTGDCGSFLQCPGAVSGLKTPGSQKIQETYAYHESNPRAKLQPRSLNSPSRPIHIRPSTTFPWSTATTFL